MKVELSHHEQDSEGKWRSAKSLVFVLDQLQEDDTTKKEKKRKKTPITAKTFGAYVSIAAAKSADNLCLAWRCRTFPFDLFWNFVLGSALGIFLIYITINIALRMDTSSSNSKGGRVIMPIRPVMLLKYQLEVNNETVCLV